MKKQIAVVGTGLIGRRHAQAIRSSSSASLARLVDPSADVHELASAFGVPFSSSLDELLAIGGVDGVVLSTPNEFHVAQALQCIEAGVPVLVEKPLAVDVAGARRIVDASEQADVPVLVGHHRRHNPIVSGAFDRIQKGEIGRITAVHATTWFYKPDDYFNASWRSQPGAGPIYINLIHDVDMLRHLCGEVSHVQAMESSGVRNSDVEDTAVILLRFANGALGTMSVSDCTVSPWSWELTSAENPAYPKTDELCLMIGGTQGSLTLPNVSVWHYSDERSWWKPINERRHSVPVADPLVEQIEQFARVIEGVEAPLVSARDGILNQRVLDAIKQSSREHTMIAIE